MKVSPIRSEFVRMTGERYSATFCAVCGWGIRYGEETARDENNHICHAACVEKEDQYETERYIQLPAGGGRHLFPGGSRLL